MSDVLVVCCTQTLNGLTQAQTGAHTSKPPRVRAHTHTRTHAHTYVGQDVCEAEHKTELAVHDRVVLLALGEQLQRLRDNHIRLHNKIAQRDLKACEARENTREVFEK
jgi:hypothetical protein